MRRLLVTTSLVVALVAAGGIWAIANHAESLPPDCSQSLGANVVDNNGTQLTFGYSVPLAGGHQDVNAVLPLAGVSCRDLEYTVVALNDLNNKRVIGSASTTGDGQSNTLRFRFPVSDDDTTNVCVFATVSGPDSKGKGSGLVDRVPDGTDYNNTDTDRLNDYCAVVQPGAGSGGYH